MKIREPRRILMPRRFEATTIKRKSGKRRPKRRLENNRLRWSSYCWVIRV